MYVCVFLKIKIAQSTVHVQDRVLLRFYSGYDFWKNAGHTLHHGTLWPHSQEPPANMSTILCSGKCFLRLFFPFTNPQSHTQEPTQGDPTGTTRNSTSTKSIHLKASFLLSASFFLSCTSFDHQRSKITVTERAEPAFSCAIRAYLQLHHHHPRPTEKKKRVENSI